MHGEFLVVSLNLFWSWMGSIDSNISCYYCSNVSAELCVNTTITCRYPADSCYTKFTHQRTQLSKACVWSGHCTPYFLCRTISSCELNCCYGDDLCNRDAIHGNYQNSCEKLFSQRLTIMLALIINIII